MKKILLAASAALATVAMAAPAMAQSNDSSVTLNGRVTSLCNIPSITTTQTVNLNLDANGYVHGGDEGWTDVFDVGALLGTTEAWCNTATKIGISGEAMLHETQGVRGNYGLPNGFTAAIPMQFANASVGGANGVSWATTELNTGNGLDVAGGAAAKTIEKTSTGAFAGPVTGVLQIWNADLRPIAGSYSSTWTVTVSNN